MRTSRGLFTLFFIALVLTYSIGKSVLLARGVESALLSWLYRIGIVWLFVWWVKIDARKRQVVLPYCLGVLATVGALFFWPYYLVRTRGAKGLLLILGYIAITTGGGLVGIVAYTLLGGQIENLR